MSSVIVVYKGSCPDRGVQDELLSYVRILAQRHIARWSGPTLPRPSFVEHLAERRAEGWPPVPLLRHFDHPLTGHIKVRTDVATDPSTLVAEARRRGVVYEEESPASRYGFLWLERLQVRGLAFRLYDPRALYPWEDRMSLVFLESEALPCLNGLLALVDDRDCCALFSQEGSRRVDWLAQCPFLHLRYYLEEWTDKLFSWMKVFFMPELYYWRNEEFPGYEDYSRRFGTLSGHVGAAKAKESLLAEILDDFEREAEAWEREMTTW